jgi:hypothetical protein
LLRRALERVQLVIGRLIHFGTAGRGEREHENNQEAKETGHGHGRDGGFEGAVRAERVRP